MNFWNNMSLKKKILMIIGGLSVAYFTCGLLLQMHVVKLWKQKELNSFAGNNIKLASAISAQFYERYGDIQAIASNGSLQSKEASVRESALNTYVGLYGIYNIFVMLDKKGNVISASNVDPKGNKLDTTELYKKNFADAPWFQAALNGKFTEDKEKGFVGTYVEDPHFDEVVAAAYGKKIFGNSFSTQVKGADGEVLGVITARADFKWVEHEFELLYQNLAKAQTDDVEMMLLNKQGQLIVDLRKYDINKPWERYEAPLLKEKIDHYSNETIADIDAGKSAILFDTNKENKLLELVSFAAIEDPKFVSSLGWHTLVVTNEEEVLGDVIRARNIFVVVFSVLGVIGMFFGFRFSNALSNKLSNMATEINRGADSVTLSSGDVSSASSSLSSSTQEQAAAVQETVAAIDEVSAMVTKSADNAKQSLTVANASNAAAAKGKQSIESMLKAMEDIKASNESIMNEVEESNRQFNSIVNLINDIGQKTKVINDIVFQTKLLSFNASVEAARAGEHGKGFAVVAEEVGNLAQMSGNAAKEISQLLENSTKQVATIAEETKSKVTNLMADNKHKVENGNQNARACATILDEIVENVSKVGEMVTEISTASSEQSQGVAEITKAMNQLGVVSQENAALSNRTSVSSSKLLQESDGLRKIVTSLLNEVQGNASQNAISNVSSDAEGGGSVSKLAKVLPIKKKSNAESMPKAVAPKTEIKVSGGASLPSADDSRFEDV